ncbi:Hypothetical protein R9X50_00796200 [Acrodontium crateriforme]|uniref:Histidine kinase n=1 Tax=Acrodontium crateriforme TaxID=150365 RepID=A0AAQ3MCV7_9PEZI|nr:Hypothetical protein R9X50_00796200 [Acrodontium crateriforme]
MSPDDPPSALDQVYEHLKEHDHEWLETTLRNKYRERAAAQKYLNHKPQTNATYRYSPAVLGPHDITAPELSYGCVVSDHILGFRQFDWASTEIGPMTAWPLELRRVVNLCMAYPHPTCLWWGPNHICIHNESYKEILADRHSQAMGKRVFEVWPELHDEAFCRAFAVGDATGKSSSGLDDCCFVSRKGDLHEIWVTWAMSPIAGDKSNIGFWNTVVESTQQVLYKRRTSLLLTLERQATEITTLSEFWGVTLTGLEAAERDVPFAALYSAQPTTMPDDDPIYPVSVSTPSSLSSFDRAWDFPNTTWNLEGTIHSDVTSVNLPETIEGHQASNVFGPLFEIAMVTGKPQLLRVADGTFPSSLQKGVANSRGYGDTCTTAVLMPIRHANRGNRAGILILGLNTRRPYDDPHQDFVRSLSNQLVRSFSTVTLAEDEARLARRAAELAAQDHIRLSENLALIKEEAKANEKRFRQMADHSPIAMFEVNDAKELIYVNDIWYEVTGNSPHLPLSEVGINTVHDDDQAMFGAQWAKLQQGESVRFEVRFNRPFVADDVVHGEKLEGETWILIAAYADCRSDGSVRGILGCLVDISRQKWMEGYQQRRTHEALELKRQQEAFMDLQAHETRNPLAAIMLCTENLLNTFEQLLIPADDPITVTKQSVESGLEDAETIMTCAQHQKRIIDDVLTISKLDAGLVTIAPCKVQPYEVVAMVLKIFNGELSQADISLQLVVDPSYRKLDIDWALLDPSRVQQILINLITNAIKFTKNSDIRQIVVTLAASVEPPKKSLHGVEYSTNDTIENSTTCDDDQKLVYLSVSVKDTGRGIKEEELIGLFRRFQQASPKTHVNYGGSGLGLFISKHLAELQGGKIGAASEYGAGSNFSFFVKAYKCLPDVAISGTISSDEPDLMSNLEDQMRPIGSRSTSFDQATPVRERHNSATASLHILLAEDNLVNQRVMAKQLERTGHEVTVANHGKEALDCIYKSQFCRADCPRLDLVLMDVEMPQMDGLECARRIREMQASGEITGHVPLIAVTANARKEQQNDALEAGMDAVVTKPFRLEDLLPTMQRVRRLNKPQANGRVD